ncbi:tetratricopeptide repeat protein [Solihabitans fulvus]|uniref:Tetratricopeptide repeat protein n=1 Tax=Solihabitans fulvus TaxID=1892852 RepID=A0A5B2XP28_9PSEU|nr:BTAD domain-containing putative transcriptional regulator [Solihabitans fulvus]KAA2265668.1 tetratricopeptide repeat protein [Solihabitans fulvus]
MEFRILGPIEVWGPAGQARLPGARQAALLAALLLQANRVVSVDELIEAAWGDRPPSAGAAALQTAVFRLRGTLAGVQADADGRLSFTSGYRLRVEPGELDLDVFRDRLRDARASVAAGRLAEAAADFLAAAELWRGTPLTGLSGGYFEPRVAGLTEDHLAAVEDRMDLELNTGGHARVVADLRGLTSAHPIRERLRVQLMLALYRSGRQAEALRAFQDARAALLAEVGVGPGPELIELHQAILRGDPVLTGAPARPESPTRRDDLPRDLPDFAGRDAELRRLLGVDPDRAAVVIEAIDGMAGVGKTALAVHAAHLLADRFPDARLFVDLHGHSAERAATDPMAALDLLLRALGVPEQRIPQELDARSALWRAELAGRKVLVVLDNAASAAQVRPLLPGASGCLALVTSRRRLADLESAATLSLDVLPHEHAVALFAGILGDEDSRAAAEPAAVDEVVTVCGCLPLAIRIAAARLRTRPTWTVRDLADRLTRGHRGLAELATGDRSVTAAFALSYGHLADDERRLFRLLALHPGPDFDAHAAAAVADVGVGEADRLLEELVDVHLLQQRTPGRYRFHDLLGQHAAKVLAQDEPEEDRARAVEALFGHYLGTAFDGDRLLAPHRPPIELAGVVGPRRFLADEDAAVRWFDAEYQCLLATQRLAVAVGRHELVWQLAWTLTGFQVRRGRIHDHVVAWDAGLAAAQRLGDRAGQTLAHRSLGRARAQLGLLEEARGHLERALALAEADGDLAQQAHVHNALAVVWERLGDGTVALAHATNALRLFQELDNPMWTADGLNSVGWYAGRLGDHARARDCCEQALALHRQHRHREGEAATLDSLGYIEHAAGRHAAAIGHYDAAIALFHELGNAHYEANALDGLAESHLASGDTEGARDAWLRAIGLYESQDRRADADRVRQRLRELDEH